MCGIWIVALGSLDGECEPLGAYSTEEAARDAATRLGCEVRWVPLDEDPAEIAAQSFVNLVY